MNKIRHSSSFQIIMWKYLKLVCVGNGMSTKLQGYIFALKCSIRVHLTENGIEIVLGACNLRFVIRTIQLMDTC